jgi:hypothetical protein
MLYVKDSLVGVGQGSFMEVALVAGVADPYGLDVGSLKLEGDLFSNRATLLTQTIAGSQYPVVRFDDLQLVETLQRDVQNHVAVIHRVRLTGKFSGDTEQTLLGQANVHLGKR